MVWNIKLKDCHYTLFHLADQTLTPKPVFCITLILYAMICSKGKLPNSRFPFCSSCSDESLYVRTRSILMLAIALEYIHQKNSD